MENNRPNHDINQFNPYPYVDERGIGTPHAQSPSPAPIAPSEPFKPIPPPSFPGWSGQSIPAGNYRAVPMGPSRPDFLLNLIFVGILWELWICLYPVAFLAGLFTLAVALPFFRAVVPADPVIGQGIVGISLGILAALIALWMVSRLEHKLAKHKVFRVLRHIVRIPLLGLAAIVAIQESNGLSYNPTPDGIAPILRVPMNLAIVVAVMIAAHFILWNWDRARAFWHRRLEGARLRSFNA